MCAEACSRMPWGMSDGESCSNACREMVVGLRHADDSAVGQLGPGSLWTACLGVRGGMRSSPEPDRRCVSLSVERASVGVIPRVQEACAAAVHGGVGGTSRNRVSMVCLPSCIRGNAEPRRRTRKCSCAAQIRTASQHHILANSTGVLYADPPPEDTSFIETLTVSDGGRVCLAQGFDVSVPPFAFPCLDSPTNA